MILFGLNVHNLNQMSVDNFSECAYHNIQFLYRHPRVLKIGILEMAYGNVRNGKRTRK